MESLPFNSDLDTKGEMYRKELTGSYRNMLNQFRKFAEDLEIWAGRYDAFSTVYSEGVQISDGPIDLSIRKSAGRVSTSQRNQCRQITELVMHLHSLKCHISMEYTIYSDRVRVESDKYRSIPPDCGGADYAERFVELSGDGAEPLVRLIDQYIASAPAEDRPWLSVGARVALHVGTMLGEGMAFYRRVIDDLKSCFQAENIAPGDAYSGAEHVLFINGPLGIPQLERLLDYKLIDAPCSLVMAQDKVDDLAIEFTKKGLEKSVQEFDGRINLVFELIRRKAVEAQEFLHRLQNVPSDLDGLLGKIISEADESMEQIAGNEKKECYIAKLLAKNNLATV